jgi:rhodanese-related sulfurtransferase
MEGDIMSVQRRWIFLVLVIAALIAACGPSLASPGSLTKNADGYTDITVEQLAAIFPNKDFTLVNVHIPYEGDIPQTDLSIPFDQITEHLDELPEKDAPIVLYCRSGGMSTTAAEVLADLGYINIMELDGGFNAWKAAGHDFVAD